MCVPAVFVAMGASAATAATAATASTAAIAVAGAATTAYSANQQAKYQSAVAGQNSQIAERNAVAARQEGAMAAQQQQQKNAAINAAIRSTLAANGIDVNSGSGADIQISQGIVGKTDTDTILRNAERKAQGFQGESAGFNLKQSAADAAGTNAIIGGGFNVGNTLLKKNIVSPKWDNMTSANTGY